MPASTNLLNDITANDRKPFNYNSLNSNKNSLVASMGFTVGAWASKAVNRNWKHSKFFKLGEKRFGREIFVISDLLNSSISLKYFVFVLIEFPLETSFEFHARDYFLKLTLQLSFFQNWNRRNPSFARIIQIVWYAHAWTRLITE